jgi:hypothetical protein
LRAEGLIIRPPVRDSIDAMLWWWEKRVDLRPQLSDAKGNPDIAKLIAFAQTVTDSTAVSLVPFQGGIAELKGRMGLVQPTDPDITSTFFWLFANRKNPQIDTDGVIGVFADYWRERPEERVKFIKDGRLQLDQLIFWAVSLPSDDPSFAKFDPIAFPLEQLPAEFSK